MVFPTRRGINPVAYSPGLDQTTVPNPKVAKGIGPEDVVNVSQLREELQTTKEQLEQDFQLDLTPVEQALTQERERALTAEAELNDRIEQIALMEIRSVVSSAAMVDTLPASTATVIPGFTPGAPDPETGRLFVNSGDATSGFYVVIDGAYVRDPAFTTADAFRAGQLVYVNSGDKYYYLNDNAEGTAGGGITTDYSLFRSGKIITAEDGQAIYVTDNGDTYRINLRTNEDNISQASGRLDLSVRRIAQIEGSESVANQAAADNLIQNRQIQQQASQIQSLTDENAAQGQAISLNANNIAALTIRETDLERTVAEMQPRLQGAIDSNTRQDDSLTQHALQIATHGTQITQIRSDIDTVITPELRQLTADNIEQAGDIASAQQTIQAHGLRLTNVENLAGQTAETLRTEVTQNQQQQVSIDTLFTRMQTVEASEATKQTAQQVRDIWYQLKAIESPILPLVGARATLYVDANNARFTRTEFRIQLPGTDYEAVGMQTISTPKICVDLPKERYFSGNEFVCVFYNAVGDNDALVPVDNNALEVFFNQGARPPAAASVQPTL